MHWNNQAHGFSVLVLGLRVVEVMITMHAHAPDDLFLALELVVEHAERSRRTGLSPADQITFEEQLLGGLCIRGFGESERGDCQGKSGRNTQGFHGAPFNQCGSSRAVVGQDYNGDVPGSIAGVDGPRIQRRHIGARHPDLSDDQVRFRYQSKDS